LYIALEAVGGRLTLGDLALYTAAAASVQTSVSGLFTAFSGMYENNLYLDTLYRFLDTKPEITAPESPRPMPSTVEGHIEFDSVTFSYPGAEEPALDHVSFEIRPGETVAVVGRNGAGKSTLFKLLCRLYDPTGGRILLDGVDIREYDPVELRTRISAMFQDYVTYQGTAAENIGLGDLTRLEDREHIENSARRAGADERIERLASGRRSRSRGRSSGRHRSWCSTNRPRPSTRRRSTTCSPGCASSRRAGRRCTSHTGSRPCARRSASCCWSTGRSPSTARTRS
jgi:ATP-binding cassette subfamily B protein